MLILEPFFRIYQLSLSFTIAWMNKKILHYLIFLLYAYYSSFVLVPSIQLPIAREENSRNYRLILDLSTLSNSIFHLPSSTIVFWSTNFYKFLMIFFMIDWTKIDVFQSLVEFWLKTSKEKEKLPMDNSPISEKIERVILA